MSAPIFAPYVNARIEWTSHLATLSSLAPTQPPSAREASAWFSASKAEITATPVGSTPWVTRSHRASPYPTALDAGSKTVRNRKCATRQAAFTSAGNCPLINLIAYASAAASCGIATCPTSSLPDSTRPEQASRWSPAIRAGSGRGVFRVGTRAFKGSKPALRFAWDLQIPSAKSIAGSRVAPDAVRSSLTADRGASFIEAIRMSSTFVLAPHMIAIAVASRTDASARASSQPRRSPSWKRLHGVVAGQTYFFAGTRTGNDGKRGVNKGIDSHFFRLLTGGH